MKKLFLIAFALLGLSNCALLKPTPDYYDLNHDRFFVEINGTKTITQLTKEGGCDLVLDEKMFPVIDKTERWAYMRIFSYSPNCLSSPSAIIEEMKRQKCRPATIEELVALGNKYPWLPQMINPIVALGSMYYYPADSIYREEHWSPELEMYAGPKWQGKRALDIHYFSGKLDENFRYEDGQKCYFAAISEDW